MVPDRDNAFHGIYAAIVCPMRLDFLIDEAALARHATDVAAVPGIVGVLCNGHAGENFALTREEKRRVVEVVTKAIGNYAIVVAGINAESSLEAAEHARDAEAAGADVLMVFGPNSWALGQDNDMAVRHHRYVIEATKSPVMLFQASVSTGKSAYAPDVLAQLLKLPRVVGVKEGSWEVAAYERTRRIAQEVAPHVAIMGSGDEHLLTSYVIGSEGSLVSLAIITPAEIVALDAAVRRGDLEEARRLHAIIQPLANVIYGTPPGLRATARLKACLKLLGRIPCDAVRPPIGPLDTEEMRRLEQTLAAAGLRSSGRLRSAS
jgi:4-hydroxy-tetrahydrodipicolinate synthase